VRANQPAFLNNKGPSKLGDLALDPGLAPPSAPPQRPWGSVHTSTLKDAAVLKISFDII
jgi:hypothetical protein